MPYLKFDSKNERMKARDIWMSLLAGGGKLVSDGLVATVNDSHYGPVDFCSKDPYLEAFDRANIRYTIIPREQISARYVDFLRLRHPNLLDEL